MMSVDIHPLTNNPTQAWEELSKTQKCDSMKIPKVPPISSDKVRIVCMSDTHSCLSKMKFYIPDGDIFIHAGDFTWCGSEGDVWEFNKWLGELPHKYKVVIAGNHDLRFDPDFKEEENRRSVKANCPLDDELPEATSTKDVREILTNCIYLEDSAVELYGLKLYGTPWQPEHIRLHWAFNLPRGEECLKKWDLIPNDTDILITHTPPLGHGDLSRHKVRAGCVELLTTVQKRVKPKYHVFGHIHEGYGMSTDGSTVFINASTCNVHYQPVNRPIRFDVPLPPGVTKSDVEKPCASHRS